MDSDVLLRELAGVLQERKRLWMPAAGFSMGQTWREADALEIVAVEASELKRFDVVVFNRGDVWVAHRIVQVGRSVSLSRSHADESRLSGDASPYLVTKGDGMWHLDAEAVRSEQVVGKVSRLRFSSREKTVDSKLSGLEWLRLWVACWRPGHRPG